MISWLLIVLFFPAATLVHVAASRFSPRNREIYLRHRTALRSALSVICLFTGLHLFLLWQTEGAWARTLYLFLCLTTFGHLYFLMFCNSETGRRYFLMNLLLKKPLDICGLRKAYSHDYIIGMRIQRLLYWGIIREEKGLLHLSHLNSLRFSKLHRFWAKILGFEWPKSS